MRRARVAVVAVLLVGLTASALSGFSSTTTPRLGLIEAAPTSLQISPTPVVEAAADAAPTPTPTATETATGNVQPGVAGNGSPPGQWQYADGSGPMFGTGGAVWTYRVAVESGVPVSVPEFTAAVDGALGDYRGWAGAGTLRMARVPGGAASNFTVVLAQPWTAYSLCLGIGIDIRIGGVPFTNCQAGATVVINGDRYQGGVGGYGAGLSVYRQYAINHEVGHRLGRGHVGCPGPGALAPVMQQQTISLQGCVANAWPYPDAAAPPPPPPPDPEPGPTTPTTPPPTPSPSPSPSPTPSPSQPAVPG
jgi:hypothetical protein